MLKNYSPPPPIICPHCRNVAAPSSVSCPLCGYNFRMQWAVPIAQTLPAKKQSSLLDVMLNSIAKTFIVCVLIFIAYVVVAGVFAPRDPPIVGYWRSYDATEDRTDTIEFKLDGSGLIVHYVGNQLAATLTFHWRKEDNRHGVIGVYRAGDKSDILFGNWTQTGKHLYVELIPIDGNLAPPLMLERYHEPDKFTGIP